MVEFIEFYSRDTAKSYKAIVLFTDVTQAGLFYDACGYKSVNNLPKITHQKFLSA
ncbi:hypothetical protein [Acinetobacter stercoris]|uniref:hypothetical protein n=1 Tax=Acinetobacter stercoris TaxID=2126983 RepID=UPI00148D7F6A|nr:MULTISPECIES: hypothetical protein [Acinetobacter]